MSHPEEYSTVAKLGKAHGIRGEIKFFPYEGIPDDLYACQEVRLLVGNQPPRVYTVSRIRAQGRALVVRLAGVDDRSQAEALTGAEIQVPRAFLEDAGGEGRYWYEYEGLEVVTDTGQVLGRVTSLFATGAHEIMVVADRDREYMIPVTAEIVTAVDLAAGRITVSPPPGLLEMNG